MKQTTKKLALSKETISTLNSNRLEAIKGGIIPANTIGETCFLCVPKTRDTIVKLEM